MHREYKAIARLDKALSALVSRNNYAPSKIHKRGIIDIKRMFQLS